MVDQIITTAVGLGLLAGGYILWLITGIVNAAVNTKTWSWKKTATDLSKAALMGVVILGLVALSNGLDWYAGALGFDITEFTDGASVTVMLGGIVAGIALYYSRAVKNTINFLKLPTSVKRVEGKETDYKAVADATKETVGEVVNNIYEFFNQSKESVESHADIEEVGGRGAYYNVPINSYDSFRTTVLGKGYDVDGAYGYQCWDGAALVWQQLGRNLLTGNGAASGCWNLKRDVNAGNDFTLITNVNDVKRGDVVVFGAGTYGHIGFADANYAGNGVISVLGQNQGGSPKGAAGGAGFNVVNVNASSFLGAFRLKKWATNNTAPAAPLKDLNVIAQEVKAGKWGNDPERSQKLKAAGYDAAAVQSIVNALCKPTVTPPEPAKKTTISQGDIVVPTKLVDYTGRTLVQYYPNYTVKQLKGDRAVLYYGSACFAAMNVANLRRA